MTLPVYKNVTFCQPVHTSLQPPNSIFSQKNKNLQKDTDRDTYSQNTERPIMHCHLHFGKVMQRGFGVKEDQALKLVSSISPQSDR